MVDPDIGERHYSEWAVKRDLGFRFVVSSKAEFDTNICFGLEFFYTYGLYIVDKVDADPPPRIIVIVVVVVVTVLEKTKYPMSSVNGHFQGGAGPGCDDNELGDDNHDDDVVDDDDDVEIFSGHQVGVKF